MKVLDLTRVIAGPVATRTLAAWGADVLRVDSPRLPEIASQCIDTLVGKRSTLLDAADGADRVVLERLLAEADVVVQGYRPGALARLELDAAHLAERYPHLTAVTLSAWGSAGPWSNRRGFDSLVQAPTGLADLEREPDGRPGVLPATVLDHGTGYLAAAAVALSLATMQAGGPASHCQLPLAQTSAWLSGVAPDEPVPQSATDVDVGSWLVDLPGPGGGVTVLGPPGRLGALQPGWTASTRFGVDPPAFLPSGQ